MKDKKWSISPLFHQEPVYCGYFLNRKSYLRLMVVWYDNPVLFNIKGVKCRWLRKRLKQKARKRNKKPISVAFTLFFPFYTHLMWVYTRQTQRSKRSWRKIVWRSGAVQFLHVFNAETQKENKLLLASQMKFFVKSIRRCGNYLKSGYTNDLVIHQESNRRLALNQGEDEQNVKFFLFRLQT